MSTLTLDGNSLLYVSKYDPGLVADLKQQIPPQDRQWDKDRKAWRVTVNHAATLVHLTKQYLGETIHAPSLPTLSSKAETRILSVRYLGATKDRGDGKPTASGWVDGGWNAIFPETILRAWFEAPAQPNEANTLYQVLATSQTATPNELKAAYRRLARQWHPDVCREPNATQVFQRINQAYETLADTKMRARYDAGLKLTATLKVTDRAAYNDAPSYRAPLRCGLIMAEGRQSLSRFAVERIFAWEDITDGDGRILVSSWPVGAQMFVEQWV